MPEPSREAREAAEAVTGSVSRWYYAKPARRVNMDTPRDTIARALDDFAETVTQERDALRRQIRDAINALNTDTVTDLTHAQDGTLRMAMQAHLSGVNALRRRVEELEAAAAELRGAQIVNQNAIRIQKARAEAAEKALDPIVDALERAIPPDLWDEMPDYAQFVPTLTAAQAREARRARGKA